MPDAPGEREPRRTRDPEETRRDILAVATAEFAAHGLRGARVDEIAARTRTTKRMIYYYFGGKEQLYAAVIEAAYGGIRDLEAALQLDSLPAADAMRSLVEATFDHHAAHPELVRLVVAENINGGQAIAGNAAVARRNESVIPTIRALLERGVREGAFRPGVDPLDLHMLISGSCFHRVSNHHTLRVLFGFELDDPRRAAAQRRMAVEAVLRFLAPLPGELPSPAGTSQASEADPPSTPSRATPPPGAT
ncbi:TetR/AcrR family transcriptional regulator [Roseomonas sp. BN140053]|uniref:TetR/AcrR family transcriptional regulator n=1 Tax=Roseomonas sp. BN140053 TaxID=3391898 RepID=UPI0039E870FA